MLETWLSKSQWDVKEGLQYGFWVSFLALIQQKKWFHFCFRTFCKGRRLMRLGTAFDILLSQEEPGWRKGQHKRRQSKENIKEESGTALPYEFLCEVVNVLRLEPSESRFSVSYNRKNPSWYHLSVTWQITSLYATVYSLPPWSIKPYLKPVPF